MRQALSELEALALDRPVFDPSMAEKRFVIAAVDYLAILWLPQLRAILAERAPSVRLAVHTLDESSIAGRLGTGKVHLYLGVRGDTERGLESAPLFEDSFCMMLDAAHPMVQEPLSLDDYAALPHVHVSPRREPGSIVDRALASTGKERDVVLEVPYFGLVPSLLNGTDLVATLPRSLAEHFAERHPLAILDAPLALPTIGYAWPGTPPSRAILR